MTADRLPAIQSYLSLVLDLQSGKKPVEVELAGVRWVSEYRCGLEFIRISDESSQRLSEFVALLEQAL
jgi:c-di-GMP-binding flagellar brake protein YcgR